MSESARGTATFTLEDPPNTGESARGTAAFMLVDPQGSGRFMWIDGQAVELPALQMSIDATAPPPSSPPPPSSITATTGASDITVEVTP